MKKIALLILVLVFVTACTTQKETTMNSADILIETNKGNFSIALYDDTPITKANFISLVQSQFYDGLTFHRYEPGFVIQGGDPNGDGTGGSEKTIPLEIVSGKSHSRGTVGMARSSDPNSASSQFFVNLVDNTFLDNQYTVFGEVTEGMDVVDSLRAGDKMIKVEIIS
ncbi:peptidylprolyl isomerase [Candidatus Woesearchaeota archaeon]|nr:peptidylprolyl isomerase [Candidatus Woesearchaeota archaeon]